ncbi:hypothetical protein SBADM41S_02234 [Streptomyces badius]
MTASGPVGALAPGALLLTAAAAALAGAWRAPRGFARTGGVVAGLAAVAAVGGVPAAAVPEDWGVLAYLAAGLALTAVVRTPLPRNAALGVLVASAAVVAGAVAGTVPGVAAVLLAPVVTAVGRVGGFAGGLPAPHWVRRCRGRAWPRPRWCSRCRPSCWARRTAGGRR